MERPVGLHPLGVSRLVGYLDGVFPCEVAVEFVFQRIEPFLEFQLVGGGN